jgi:hypothetical protein
VTRAVALALVLSGGVARAQDGGVWEYRRAVLELPSGELCYLDAGVALDGPVALERANELAKLRAQSQTPSWVATAAAVVTGAVWVADRVRAWTRP